LSLEELLMVIKSQIVRNNMRTYSTLDAPSMVGMLSYCGWLCKFSLYYCCKETPT